MTKQILLKTPRGNTAVIPVDHFVAKAKAAATAKAGAKPTLAFSSAGEEQEQQHNQVGVQAASNVFDYQHNLHQQQHYLQHQRRVQLHHQQQQQQQQNQYEHQRHASEAQEEAAAIAAAVDTSRIFEGDEYDADRQGKEELLFHLIGASKRRDVGRKRVYHPEVEDEDDGMEIDDNDHDNQFQNENYSNHESSHNINGNGNCIHFNNDEEEQKVVATRFDDMNISIDQYYSAGASTSSNRFKTRRRFYSHTTGAGVPSSPSSDTTTTATTNATANRRRQRQDPIIPRQLEDRQGQQQQQQKLDRPSGPEHNSASSPSPPPPLMVAFYYQGRKVSLDRIWEWINGSSATQSESDTSSNANAAASSSSSSSNTPQFPLYLTLSTSVRLLGGIDRQNRVGSKFGGGGVSSSQNAERERKERLKQLALESIDLAKDPYLMRNHLGTYECKLCLTLHTNEANYLAHTQGKKHQSGLAKRAHMEKLRKEREEQMAERSSNNSLKRPASGGRFVCQPATTRKVPKIGRPAYQVFKSKDPETSQRCLTFELAYKDIEKDLQPRHRFMSAFEQRVDLPKDKRYQYVLFAAEPYETIAFKIPNEPLDRDPGRLITHWDEDDKKFTVTLYFEDGKGDDDDQDDDKNTSSASIMSNANNNNTAVVNMETEGATAARTSTFAPALGSR